MKKPKINTVKTLEQWATIQAMGTYEQDYKNGELWSFNGQLYYLSHLELDPEALRELNEYYEGPARI